MMTSYVCCICMKSLDEKFNWDDVNVMREEPDLVTPSGTDLQPTDLEEEHDVQGRTRRNIGNILRTENGISKGMNNEKTTNWSAIVSTPCGHLYHLGCIYAWMSHLERRGWEPTCAYCRQDIYNTLELAYIYPVSSRPSADDDSELQKRKLGSGEKFVNGKSADVATDQTTFNDAVLCEGKRGSYFDLKFWAAVGINLLCITIYVKHVSRCVDLVELEEYEDGDFDFMFGSTWTVMILLTSLISVLIDCCTFRALQDT